MSKTRSSLYHPETVFNIHKHRSAPIYSARMSSVSELDKIFDTFIENLDLVVNKLKEDESSRPMPASFKLDEYWNKSGATFESVSTEATKLALWFSKPPLPKPEECRSLIASVEMSAIAMVSVFYGLPKEQGSVLLKDVRRAVIQAVEGIQGLGAQIKQDNYQSSESQLHSTGNVWESCDAFKTLPRNNQEAVLAVLTSAGGLVKDALEELEELQETGGESQGWEDLDHFIDTSVQDDAEPKATWSERDKSLLPPCAGLAKAARACLKKAAGAVRANGQWRAGPAAVTELDDLARVAGDISPALDNLVTCLYPPMRHGEIRLNAQKLSEILLSLLERSRTSHITKEEDQAWLAFLSKAVDHNLAKITESIPEPSDVP